MTAPARVETARYEAMADAFAQRVPGCRRFAHVGWRMRDARAPGDLTRSVVDDETGPLDAPALRALGWPVDDDDADDAGDGPAPWRVLPWIALLDPHESEALLTIDGFGEAPRVLIEPETGAHLEGASYTGSLWLMPDAWACFALWVRAPRHDDARLLAGPLLLGLRRVEAPAGLAAVVLPDDAASRAALYALLGVTQADLDASLTDAVHGTLRGP